MVSEKKFCLIKKLQIKNANHYKIPPRSRAVQKRMANLLQGTRKVTLDFIFLNIS